MELFGFFVLVSMTYFYDASLPDIEVLYFTTLQNCETAKATKDLSYYMDSKAKAHWSKCLDGRVIEKNHP